MDLNVLVADSVSPAALEVFRSTPGWRVIESSPREFAALLPYADALLVRSGAKVTAEVLENAPKLRVIGRAGVGVDNVDIAAATARGVLVMNTPGGNAVSVAEHTLALILASARSIPQASQSTKSGKWEKKKFLGTELGGKTLGIIGLGNIGLQVARRARPFAMKVVAHDPFVSRELAKDRGVEIIELDELYRTSDYISLHLSLTAETRHILNQDAFGKMKAGVRIINCARGELIDGAALEQALKNGSVAGAALDVFETEPPSPGSALLADERLIATPHIGGSTAEAQEAVGICIAEQVKEFLESGVITNAVNMPSINAEQYGRLRPYLDLAERLGSFVAQIATGPPRRLKVEYAGSLGESNSSLIRNAAVCGVLGRFLSQPPNLINAAEIAAARGVGVSESHHGRKQSVDTLTLVLDTEDGRRSVEGTVFADGSPRLISVDGIYVEARLQGDMVFTKNIDVPGVIGKFGTLLGENNINIADFSLGRRETHEGPGEPAEAVAVVRIDGPIPKNVLDQLAALDAVRFARAIELAG